MTFAFENKAYWYEFEFIHTADGPYVICTTRRKDDPYNGFISTGFPIRDGQVDWLPDNVISLHLTPEAMHYVDRLMGMKAFW